MGSQNNGSVAGPDPAILLLDAAAVVGRAYEVRLGRDGATRGLSPATARVVMLVASEPGISPSVIAKILLQETHSVSGLLNRLEDRGLIDRKSDRLDRRVRHITVTPEGKRAAKAAERILGDVSLSVAQTVAENDGVIPCLTALREAGAKKALA